MDPNQQEHLELAAELIGAAIELTEQELCAYALEVSQSRARLRRLERLRAQVGRLQARFAALTVTTSDTLQA